MGAYLRNDRWMVFYHDESGKRRDKSFGKGDEAKYIAEEVDAAIKDSRKNGWPKTPEAIIAEISAPKAAPSIEKIQMVKKRTGKNTITFGQLCKAYMDDLEVNGRTERHIKTVRIVYNVCYQHIPEDKPAEKVTYLDDIMPLVKVLKGVSPQTGKPRSQTTINRYLDYLDAAFNFGVRLKLVTENPVSQRKKAKEAPRKVSLELKDIKKIMDEAEPHVRWAIEVCFNLGTRSGDSELLSLLWENVNFEKKEVLIYGSKTKDYRTVPVNDEFLERLKEKQKEAKTEYIIEYNGRKVTSINIGFRNACKRAGINYSVRMYDLRHLFASTMLANGADLAAVSKLMGHSRITMTANTYYQYMKGEKERAVSLLPKLEVA